MTLVVIKQHILRLMRQLNGLCLYLQLPRPSWLSYGLGRTEFPIVAQSWLYGGHVRVGMEDNIYLEKGVLAESNALLVAKAADIIKQLGGQVATAAQTRDMLNLKKV